MKERSGQFASMMVLETEIVKIDQEPAICALMADAVKARGSAITAVEKSPASSSGSTRVVEKEERSASKEWSGHSCWLARRGKAEISSEQKLEVPQLGE